ncbi:hypothetical protein BaRGS_00017536, partial [Batillaria attramentaria]
HSSFLRARQGKKNDQPDLPRQQGVESNQTCAVTERASCEVSVTLHFPPTLASGSRPSRLSLSQTPVGHSANANYYTTGGVKTRRPGDFPELLRFNSSDEECSWL